MRLAGRRSRENKNRSMSNSFTTFRTPNPEVIISLDVSADGKLLAVGQQADENSGISLSLWELPGLQLAAKLETEESCLAVRFSPTGKMLAYSDPEQELVLFDLHTNTMNTEAFPLAFTKWMSFAWDRNRLIAGGTRTEVWDAEKNGVIFTLPVDALSASRSIEPPSCALSPDGAMVAASGVEPGRIVIYDIQSGQIVNRLENTMDKARSLAFAPNGRFIAAVATTGGAGLWDLQSGKAVLPDLLNMQTDYYWCVRFHPDGEHVAFGLWSGFVELIRIKDGSYSVNQDAPVHRGRVNDVAINRQGTRMFSGGDDGVILIWDLE